jgi:hypothetical protein
MENKHPDSWFICIRYSGGFALIYETIDFNVLIRYKKASTEMEEACLMGFSGGFK